jgi:hypothetical protein
MSFASLSAGVNSKRGKTVSSFSIYLIGFIVVIIGLAIAANLIGIPSIWIGVGVLVLIGMGVLMGVSRTKRPDPPAT